MDIKERAHLNLELAQKVGSHLRKDVFLKHLSESKRVKFVQLAFQKYDKWEYTNQYSNE